MEIYCGVRASGKTMKAILLSAEKQMPIVVSNYHEIEHIKYMAKEMNLKIPDPIIVEDVRKKVKGNRKGLIVDNLDFLLRKIFGDEVCFATMEDCNIEKIERREYNEYF